MKYVDRVRYSRLNGGLNESSGSAFLRVFTTYLNAGTKITRTGDERQSWSVAPLRRARTNEAPDSGASCLVNLATHLKVKNLNVTRGNPSYAPRVARWQNDGALVGVCYRLTCNGN